MTVPASPLNGVKLALGWALLALPLVWLLVGRLVASPLQQALVLFVLATAFALVLVWRIRTIAARQHRGGGERHGAE